MTKEERSEYNKQYRAANREVILEVKRAYRTANRDKLAARQREYVAENIDSISENRKTPKARFVDHRINANRRGVEFLLTFEEWWAIWEPHWEGRGRGAGDLCMCRTNDEGPYAVGNVRIDTNTNNVKEARALQKI
tara:strand:+ start:316 stop:723 length:408 start_codon:yes stop_codon:yes gene_type:complete